MTPIPVSSRRLRLLRDLRFPDGRIQLYLEPRDVWVGAFIGVAAVYICLMPCLVIRIATEDSSG